MGKKESYPSRIWGRVEQELFSFLAKRPNGNPKNLNWLYARKLADVSNKYAISNALEDTHLEKFRDLALRRWAIEQCFEGCKSDLGMDHFV